MEPSPTAEAQRLIEPCRTSPATKMPGTLDSSRNGSRCNCHCRGNCEHRFRSLPLNTNPRSSFSTAGGSQSVFGSAPMKMNNPVADTVCSPSGRATRNCWRRPFPSASTTFEPVQTSIFDSRAISSIKYFDMLLSRDEARTRMTTRRAYWPKAMAACPAELAPPTRNTSSPLQERASARAAP